MAVEKFSKRMRATISRMEERERVSAAQISVVSELLRTKVSQRGWVSQVIADCGKVSRKAATAGKVCTMSPSEPSRTTRKRGSGIGLLANCFEECGGRMILGVAHDGDANS